jgi:hypothetical protein
LRSNCIRTDASLYPTALFDSLFFRIPGGYVIARLCFFPQPIS